MSGKKVNVIEDELEVRGAGIYCIMPYEKTDDKKKALFKIGMATKSFYERIDNYHTYFPLGVYICAFLKNPTVPKTQTKATFYLQVEKYIMNALEKTDNAERIYSTARVKNANVDKKGQTEWFYTDELSIKNIFTEANELYGGELILYSIKDINKIYSKSIKKKPHYVGEVIYPTEKVK